MIVPAAAIDEGWLFRLRLERLELAFDVERDGGVASRMMPAARRAYVRRREFALIRHSLRAGITLCEINPHLPALSAASSRALHDVSDLRPKTLCSSSARPRRACVSYRVACDHSGTRRRDTSVGSLPKLVGKSRRSMPR